jgi:hypothetical protein
MIQNKATALVTLTSLMALTYAFAAVGSCYSPSGGTTCNTLMTSPPGAAPSGLNCLNCSLSYYETVYAQSELGPATTSGTGRKWVAVNTCKVHWNCIDINRNAVECLSLQPFTSGTMYRFQYSTSGPCGTT